MNLKISALSIAAVLSLALTGAARASVVVTSTNVPVSICDLCTVTSTLNIGSHLALTDVNVRLTNLTHTFDADLRISLISPSGTTVVLSDRRGSSADNFIGTIFDDQALTAIANGAAPFTGSFRPDASLSAFNGQDAFGTWTLRVADMAGADVGSINAWGLELTSNDVPEPATLALSTAALAAVAFSRRRRQA